MAHWCLFSSQLLDEIRGLTLVLFLLANQFIPVLSCPESCFCAPHSRNVQCSSKGFDRIPDEVPDDTLELNLNKNHFANTRLTRRNFTRFKDMTGLFLGDCNIETIEVDTFADLKLLDWLDLSDNKIKFIGDYTFKSLILKHLFLNGNHGIKFSLGAFAGLITDGLYLHECSLKRLPVDLLSPLEGSLKVLWLQDNNFETFDPKWRYFFQSLRHIQIGKNAFHCNCEIRWLHAYFLATKDEMFSKDDKPQCASPANIRGKTFQDLKSDDFWCQLATFENVDAAFNGRAGKLTCLAKGDPTPTLHWVSPSGSTETYYPDESDREARENMAVLVLRDFKLEKKVTFKCIADNLAGNVTFALNIAWPTTTTTTPKPTPSGKIIHDRTTRSPLHNNFAGDDSGVYKWPGVQSENSLLSSSKDSGRFQPNNESDEHHFSMADIVGAVVGTFILTLLLCLTAFHYYHKHRDRVARDAAEHQYSVPHEINNKLGPHDGFVMNESNEDNRTKMINNDCVT